MQLREESGKRDEALEREAPFPKKSWVVVIQKLVPRRPRGRDADGKLVTREVLQMSSKRSANLSVILYHAARLCHMMYIDDLVWSAGNATWEERVAELASSRSSVLSHQRPCSMCSFFGSRWC